MLRDSDFDTKIKRLGFSKYTVEILTNKQNLLKFGIAHCVNEKSLETFIQLPIIFGGYSVPLVEIIKEFNLCFNGIEFEGDNPEDIIPHILYSTTFKTNKIYGMNEDEQEKEINKFLCDKYGCPLTFIEVLTAFFRPKIIEKIFSSPPAYCVNIKQKDISQFKMRISLD